MTNRTLLVVPALLALFLVPACAHPVAPDSFTLTVQIGRDLGMDRITLDNVDSLTLLFEPMMEGTRDPADFSQPMIDSFEDGQIMLSVDANGLLTMLVSREYILENAVPDATGGNPRLDLELWTADQMRHMPAPQIRGTVTRMGNQIGIGSLPLADWPLPAGGMAQLNIPCATGMATLCTAPR
jgi:hypothetical protein